MLAADKEHYVLLRRSLSTNFTSGMAQDRQCGRVLTQDSHLAGAFLQDSALKGEGAAIPLKQPVSV